MIKNNRLIKQNLNHALAKINDLESIDFKAGKNDTSALDTIAGYIIKARKLLNN